MKLFIHDAHKVDIFLTKVLYTLKMKDHFAFKNYFPFLIDWFFQAPRDRTSSELLEYNQTKNAKSELKFICLNYFGQKEILCKSYTDEIPVVLLERILNIQASRKIAFGSQQNNI